MNSKDNVEPPGVEVQFAVTSQYCPTRRELLHWAESALHSKSVGVTIRIIDAAEIQMLNATFRSKNKPTNVLSFPADFPAEVELPYLGDIAICADIVNAEAYGQNKLARAHWAHMVIHGVLHLRGHDHMSEPDAQRMEQLEIELLDALGFANPYTDEQSHNRVRNG